MSDELLILFVKNPELGKVKSRLAQSIGEEEALAIYLRLLARCHELTESLSMDVIIYYNNYIDSEDLWDNRQYQKALQKGSNLGEKMANAIDEQLSKGYRKVCLVGSDIYDLSKKIIEKAFKKLDESDVVIGPAKDGGYYLIGLKNSHPELFKLSRWSHDQVFRQTVELIENYKLSYETVDLLNDIDRLDDLKNTPLFNG